jgi:hypothetical protein
MEAEDAFAVLLESAKDGSSWEFASRQGSVTISKRDMQDGRVSSFRGQCILPWEPAVVAAVVLDPELQTVYNPQLKQSTVAKTVDKQSRVMHKVFKAKKVVFLLRFIVAVLTRWRSACWRFIATLCY